MTSGVILGFWFLFLFSWQFICCNNKTCAFVSKERPSNTLTMVRCCQAPTSQIPNSAGMRLSHGSLHHVWEPMRCLNRQDFFTCCAKKNGFLYCSNTTGVATFYDCTLKSKTDICILDLGCINLDTGITLLRGIQSDKVGRVCNLLEYNQIQSKSHGKVLEFVR